MTNLEELIETTEKLCKSLEKAAADEIKFCVDIQLRLEQMSWEALKHSNELKQIQSYIQ